MVEIKDKIPCGGFYLDPETLKVIRKEGKKVLTAITKEVEIPDLSDKYISTKLKGQPRGVAELDEAGKILANNLPSYIDKAEEYPTKEAFPEVGQDNIIYVDISTNKEYRWSGTIYVEIFAGLTLGNTPETAFRGDHGEEIYNATVNNKLVRTNPVLTAEDVGADTKGTAKELIAQMPKAIFLDVEKLGFNLEEIHNGGATIDITPETKPVFDRLRKTEEIANGVYLILSGVVTELSTREFNSQWNVYSAVVDGLKIQLELMDTYVVLRSELIQANQHNLGMIKAIPTEDENSDYLLIDKQGLGRIKKLPIDNEYINDKTLMSSKDTFDRLSCFKDFYGNPAIFTPIGGYPIKLHSDIICHQYGEGEPSINNERPISGWTDITINVSNYKKDVEYVQHFDETVYGGTYKNNGTLTINFVSRLFNGSENWTIKSVPNGRKQIFQLVDETINASGNISTQLCSTHKTNPPSLPAWDSDCIWAIGNAVYVGGGLASKYKDIEAWKTELGKHNMQLVYELATPKIVNFPPIDIYTVNGENAINSSTGHLHINAPVLGCSDEELKNLVSDYLLTEEGKQLVKNIATEQLQADRIQFTGANGWSNEYGYMAKTWFGLINAQIYTTNKNATIVQENIIGYVPENYEYPANNGFVETVAVIKNIDTKDVSYGTLVFPSKLSQDKAVRLQMAKNTNLNGNYSITANVTYYV